MALDERLDVIQSLLSRVKGRPRHVDAFICDCSSVVYGEQVTVGGILPVTPQTKRGGDFLGIRGDI